MLTHMFISKELISYIFKKNKKVFFVIISNFLGWGIFNVLFKSFILKKNYIVFFEGSKFNSTEFSWINNFCFGLYRKFKIFLSFVGLGYKRVFYFGNLILKLGFSHRSIFLACDDLKLVLFKKRRIKLESRSLIRIEEIRLKFLFLRLKSIYKRKGIFIKGSQTVLKLSSKKSKF